jgi:hypothetical protein
LSNWNEYYEQMTEPSFAEQVMTWLPALAAGAAVGFAAGVVTTLIIIKARRRRALLNTGTHSAGPAQPGWPNGHHSH